MPRTKGTVQLAIDVSPEFRAKIKGAAADAGKPLADFISTLLENYSARKPRKKLDKRAIPEKL